MINSVMNVLSKQKHQGPDLGDFNGVYGYAVDVGQLERL